MEKENSKEIAQNRLDRVETRLFKMVSVGVVDDRLNQGYDIISTAFLIINIIVSIAMTFESFYAAHHDLLYWTESITVFFFAVDYVLRLIASDKMYPEYSRGMSAVKYIFSGYGIIDLLSFLPYYLPVFFPAGAAVFRMFRVVRIFRLFRINAYYDSLSIIGNVLTNKKTQIFASVFIIMLLMIASSLCMYSVEHEAQPDVFVNAFSGMWWATSTLLTVGYGDIYPITFAGQVLGILIAFLGVGLVAIPTGIISAGFVEEYQKVKRASDVEQERAVHFIEVVVHQNDKWIGKKIRNIGVPHGALIATIIRGAETVIPRGDVEILEDDHLIICAEAVKGDYLSNVKEIELRKNHRWNGLRIRDLDMSRQTFIVLIIREGNLIIPNGDIVMRENDRLLLYTKDNIRKYMDDFTF